jgi:hypothetical protein
LERLFEALQAHQLIRINVECVGLYSTSVKVHPDGTGALKKGSAIHRQIPRWPDNQSSYGIRE